MAPISKSDSGGVRSEVLHDIISCQCNTQLDPFSQYWNVLSMLMVTALGFTRTGANLTRPTRTGPLPRGTCIMCGCKRTAFALSF
jgi:hypothetical protein